MRLLPPLLIAALLLPALPARADEAGERTRIAAERRTIETRFAAEEAACRERFVVTPCVDGVRARRREALSPLRHQELLLDDAERKRRAAARIDGIEARRAAAAARPAPAPRAEPLPRPPPAATPAPLPRPAKPADDGAEAAARRVQAADKRREAAATDRARIAAREAQRDPRKSAPLPVPAASR